MSYPWITLDLVYICTLSLAIICYALWTIKVIKIRLNLISRVKWTIALLAILMKMLLTVVEFI